MFKKISGTKDVLPPESFIWQELENISRNTFTLYNYKEVRLPLIEEASLFNRSLGSSTEIVTKQMFLIKKEEVNNLQHPQSVDKQEGNEPIPFVIPAGFPKSQSFPNSVPDGDDY